MLYYVICRGDRHDDGTLGRWEVVGQGKSPFLSKKEAREYAKAINPARDPIVLAVMEYVHRKQPPA